MGGLVSVLLSVWGGQHGAQSAGAHTPPSPGGHPPTPTSAAPGNCLQHCTPLGSKVAKILPDSFKRNFKDPWRRPHMLMKEEKPSYCVYMRVKRSSVVCKQRVWTAQLVHERSLCVECQSDAMATDSHCAGDGLEANKTFWTAASAPGCHGSWVRESLVEKCRCPPHSVLFV
ncbi:hypothetical protein AALO_G00071470 [Alosa alosa]|uniref:SBSPON-like C-terminal domain-containing protein n=1 Tax=Alosa alosa TaxID=278164 RepID=A0AAV6H437_9TELE|nr:hypothetical protein AALO_G00071470 [Alosa alosa]